MMNTFKCLMALVILLQVNSSCNKEDPIESLQSKSLEFRSSSGPVVINDMLHFDSFSDFEAYIQYLENQENDIEAIKSAYSKFDIDMNAESIPNLTDHPICLLMEQELFGFSSARKMEEENINLALNNGDDVFSIVENPYLKTAINVNYAVNIGTRIFKFFNNGGIVIVLNNDWGLYNSIKMLEFESIKQTSKLIVTSDAKDNWGDFYNQDLEGNILSEKDYFHNDWISESPVYCDFSDDMMVTKLNNGKMRIDFPHSKPFDIYKWTFDNGTISFDYPLIIDCSEVSSGELILDIYRLCPECPSGKRRACRAFVSFECDCGEKRTKRRTLTRSVNGQKWKIDASIWVKSGEVGCRMKYLRKFWVGWLPASNQAVCTDIKGYYKRENIDGSCSNIGYSDIKCLGKGTYPTSISLTKSDISKVFRETNKLDSGHKIKVKGTWIGFGVGSTPRLVLD